MRTWLTVTQALYLLADAPASPSRATLYRWLNTGRIPGLHTNRGWLIHIDTLHQIADKDPTPCAA